MASTIFPAAAAASSINASSITAASPLTMYASSLSLDSAIYTVTCTSTTIAKVYFYSGVSTLVTTATTVSGTVTIQLGSAVDRVRLWTDTGTNIVVTITKVASALTNGFSGTLDTITSSGTYTGTSASGYGYAVLVGGGGGGGGAQWNVGNGTGGAAGAVANKLVTLTGSMAVTIGAAGTGGAYNVDNGTAGGNSTFAGMTAGGGGPGKRGFNSGGSQNGASSVGASATGGDINSNSNGTGGMTGDVPTSTWTFVRNVIGTAGLGPSYYGGGTVQTTGYGAGGGGCESQYTQGAGGYVSGTNGAPGVLFVLRF
jgi:hypothetical protein